eukprot:scaffold50304_cov42-Phaeocystis_antarctica.AAC.1
MPCQRADALRLGVPQELCGAELQPMLTQLGRDMQYWKPRSITPAMLDEIREAKRDDPVRVALMIVNRTVWHAPHLLRASARLHACRMSARLHACRAAARLHACTPAPDAQELADSHAVPDVEFVLNVSRMWKRAVLAGATACCLGHQAFRSGRLHAPRMGASAAQTPVAACGAAGSPSLISRRATCRWTTIPS